MADLSACGMLGIAFPAVVEWVRGLLVWDLVGGWGCFGFPLVRCTLFPDSWGGIKGGSPWMCDFFGRANVRGEVSNSWKVLTTETYCHGFFFRELWQVI